MKKTISMVRAREILDSRGNPTVEVDIALAGGGFGTASVPSGASTGSYEAVELRDGGSRYGGKGVQNAIKGIHGEISERICRGEWDQISLDAVLVEIDGTPNKSRLGANAILGVSLAFSKAYASSSDKSLYAYFAEISQDSRDFVMPVPMMNIINGGKHAEGGADIQEFMIVPHGAPSFREALRYGAETFHALKKLLSSRRLSTAVGDEGGFAPALPSNQSALELIMEAIVSAGYSPGRDISLALDVAASELRNGETYSLASEKRTLTSAELTEQYAAWVASYPIVSIEDGLGEDDWRGFQEMTRSLGKKIQIVGDDLFVTNVSRLAKGIELSAGNSVLVKLNQIGTLSETISTIRMARSAGYSSVISHRSGETEDTVIADFAVGMATGQIKTGSLSRSERVAKYNRLLRIEEELGSRAVYPGMSVFPNSN